MARRSLSAVLSAALLAPLQHVGVQAESRRSPTTEDEVPLYMWVPEETKRRFLEMCQEENVSISGMLTRWADMRARVAMGTLGSEVSAQASADEDAVMAPAVASSAPQRRRDQASAEEDAVVAPSLSSSAPQRRIDQGVAAELRSGDFFLRLSQEDLKLLRKRAGKGPLLLTWTTGEPRYMDLALNLALSVRASVGPALEERFMCVALDRAARRAMRRHKFQAVLHAVPAQGPELKDAIWKMRWLVLHTLAHLGIDSLVLDSDIAVLSDPFPALHGDAHFEVMTDHFWPELHLWQYWTRPEEHINTGCIYAKASKQSEQFLLEFLLEHNESDIGGIPRHWMDQQVFNKFVERRIFHMDIDLVHMLYGADQVFRNVRAKRKSKQPLRIRVLDPVVFAHGMNYFWLRAHTSPGKEKTPVLAHANGVDGKEYFLRDRDLWYIDDFDNRFGKDSFLSYDHPTGLPLGEDFQNLVEALVVAVSLRRRLVLPGTMNCDNCPALEPYKANATLGGGNCTFDYFAWSQSFLGHHGEYTAESGLSRHHRFLQLPVRSLSAGRTSSEEIQNAVAAIRSGKAATSSLAKPRRLHVADIREAYKAVLDAGAGPWDVFECKHHDWPVGWMACRDQRFVSYHGDFAKCTPEPEQAGCGYRGVTCCEPFWGWGEKLEYFTGRRWDLPCNCGLPTCKAETPPASVDSDRQACCSHAAGAPGVSARCEQKLRMESVPEVNTPEDTQSLTSTALAELEGNSTGPAAFWRTCMLNRQLRFRDRTAEELIGHCHALASRFLLLRQNLPALVSWGKFAQALPARIAGSQAVSPDCPGVPAGLGILQPGALAALTSGLKTDGFAIADDALETSVLTSLEDWLLQASIWRTSADGVGVLQASLLGGLHCEALLLLAQELVHSADLGASGLPLTLEDISAWKYGEGVRQGAEVAASSGSLPAADLSLGVFFGEAQGKNGRLRLRRPGAAEKLVQSRRNRLVLWSSELQGSWLLGDQRQELRSRRVDLMLTLRRSQGRKGFPGVTRVTASRWQDPP